jgi:hypothetical protein
MASKFSGKPRTQSTRSKPKSKSSKGTSAQRKARAANFKSGSLNGGGGTWADIPD